MINFLIRFRISIKRGLIWIHHKLSNRQFLIAGAVVVGLWAGLTAVVLKMFVHYLQENLSAVAQQKNWIYFIAPSVGILLSYLFVKWVLGGSLTKGTAHVLMAIAKKSSRLTSHEVYSHVVTSALTVGMGGSAGLESPIVQTGSAIGSRFSTFFPVNYRDRTLLLACGAAAGISTAFNAPIAGVLFALEVLLVDVNISAFIPLLIAGATGALCSKIILQEGILLSFRQISEFNYHNVPYYVLLGIFCGVLSYFYSRLFLAIESRLNKLNTFFIRFLVGSALLGALILLFPALFGEGYSSIKALALGKPEQLFNGSPLQILLDHRWQLGLAILAIGVVKAVAVSITLGAGGNGGNFAPSLLVGACLGFAFSYLLNTFQITSLPVSNFTMVAMAGLLSGIFHAPLTGIFLIAEITGGYDLIIPLMIVAALSTAISRYLNPHSLDEMKLKQLAMNISFGKDVHVLSAIAVSDLIEKDFVPVPVNANLRTVVDAVAHSRRNIFPVVDEAGSLSGIIRLEDIREIMFNVSQYDIISVKQLMQKPPVTIDMREDMSAVMEKFEKTGVWNIPVLRSGQYIGFISQSSVFATYRERLKND